VPLNPELLLVASVAVVGVLHTIVPDHWAPIAFIARQRGWSKGETARAAFQAGIGHVVSTLVIAVVVWLAGVAVATRFGHYVDTASSIALVAFGGWIAISALREMRSGAHSHGHAHFFAHDGHHDRGDRNHHHDDRDHDYDYDHSHDHRHDGAAHAHDEDWVDDPLYAPSRDDTAVLVRHMHLHRHGDGPAHAHWHDHDAATAHAISPETEAAPPLHAHKHKTSSRTALLLILGSSPMVEGIPAFFAAGKYGFGLILLMSIVFGASTIATYVLFCVYSTASLQRIRFGALERYGEVLSGAFIALVGVAFWIWPVI
jgi:nickel/cobalt transporter (NicO) family protein